MLAVFGASGSNAPGIWGNPLFTLLVVVVGIFIFLRFCGWSKKFQLPAGLKKLIFILTGLGLVVFNIMYSMGNSQLADNGEVNGAIIALLVSIVWVFIFAFALMAETKSE
ncbi:MAG: hypothetical protein ACOX6E_07805 [Syntrophomonadaceae bacterium]